MIEPIKPLNDAQTDWTFKRDGFYCPFNFGNIWAIAY